ncbi:MAG: SagB/ThcOx family dehydrogenase [Firmicutes bacterium]|jgi:SagB-type dehydrogenase family enzyme|nr:SagB/ThcOx family dehydrogenase [Bacillota bacterium]
MHKRLQKLRIGPTFIEYTKYQHQLEHSDQMQFLPQPELTDPTPTDLPLFDLPKPDQLNIGEIDLTKAINQRVSVRKYTDQKFSLEELSYLLWTTQGIREITDRPATLRTVPSAGSRHSFETYLLINRVETLKPGLYKYCALDHKLALLSDAPSLADELTDICHRQGMVRNSAVTFFWAAEIYRNVWRYQERAYRYVHLDAGHVCQNLYLACEAIASGCCGIAAFDDDRLSEVLQIDGVNRFPVYVATVGKK